MRRNGGNPSQGAQRQPDGSVVWRIWAPSSAAVSLILSTPHGREKVAMLSECGGYHVHRQSGIADGAAYEYQLDDGGVYPDPASRWQPNGVHRPSAVFSPTSYCWADALWNGVARRDLVFYELHVGAFTPEGTLDAIIARLPQLFSLGVTAIELMPVAQFAGDRNWGYDAVYPYAVQNSYGGPQALQRFVDAAHQAGLAVFLDVVYNHLGPEGNYLAHFGPYFTDRYQTPWGPAVNFDGPECDAVRQFVIDNACMWVRDFHIDGLRLDAVHAIFDLGACHILADLQTAVQREAAHAHRLVHVFAESNQNDVRLVRPQTHGGFGLDGIWNDDFHHSIHALLTAEQDGYYQDFGRASHLVKAMNNAFVYDGCYSPFRRRRHGSQTGTIDRSRFVVCTQDHDQVGNRALGDRLSVLISPAAQRLASALLLLSPYLPLLFMGEEYGETRPFPFFCSFDDPALVEAVRRGRREEFATLKFRWGGDIPDPQSAETFSAAKLDWTWPEGTDRFKRRLLYQDLLKIRKQWPTPAAKQHTTARLLKSPGNEDRDLLLFNRGGDDGLLIAANLTQNVASTADLPIGKTRLLLSTEDVRYGGVRSAAQSAECLFPFEAMVLGEGEGGS